jgi:P4 family phage/plasmid primase-like protien
MSEQDRPPLEFREVSKSKPCPICGGGSWCAGTQARADGSPGPVRCMRWDRSGVSIPAGWHASKTIAGDGGRMFVPDDGGKPVAYAEGRSWAEIDHVESERAERNRRRAASIWRTARSQRTEAVSSYLEGRGIEIGSLPGGSLPSCIRFNSLADFDQKDEAGKWLKLPAMVCAVQASDPRGKLKGIHRTFLEVSGEGPVTKRAEGAKKQLGPCSGGSIRLSGDTSGGVLVIAEGVETALACLVATGAATLSAMDSSKLKAIELPEDWVAIGRPAAAAVVIVAGDTDRNQAGQIAAEAAARRLRGLHPHLEIVVRVPTPEAAPNLVCRDGELVVPGENVGKSVDWLDVMRTHGAEAVRSALMAGVDVAAARKKASGLDAIESAGESEPPSSRPLVPESVIEQGRRYLLERESPARDQRPGSGLWLRYWNGQFLQYTGTRYAVVSDELMLARAWTWLDGFSTMTRDGAEPLNPDSRLASDCLKAARGEVLVPTSVSMPAWLPADFKEGGRPAWGQASRSAARREREGEDGSAGKWIAARNVLIDADAWIAGELRTRPHTPRYFAMSSLPYDLPIDRIRQAMKDDALEQLVGELCPTWLDFLAGIYTDELSWHDTLQEWFGYNLIPDNSLEMMMLLVGPPRSGKGTVLTAHAAVLGEENVASTSLGDMADRFGLAQLVGKPAAQLPDAHMSKFKDGTAAVERFKSITGNDPVAVEEKALPRYTTRLYCRFTMACNELPALQDSSLGLADRLIVLRFDRSHVGKTDPTLKARIKAEAQGIMLWSLIGLRRLWNRRDEAGNVSRRIGQPLSGLELIEAIRREQSPISGFIEDACLTESSQSCPIRQLFEVWGIWCQENNRHAGSPQSFGRKLRAIVPGLREERPRDAGRRDRIYVGIAPRADYIDRIPLEDYHADRD